MSMKLVKIPIISFMIKYHFLACLMIKPFNFIANIFLFLHNIEILDTKSCFLFEIYFLNENANRIRFKNP